MGQSGSFRYANEGEGKGATLNWLRERVDDFVRPAASSLSKSAGKGAWQSSRQTKLKD
jgi:hypothetical protein